MSNIKSILRICVWIILVLFFTLVLNLSISLYYYSVIYNVTLRAGILNQIGVNIFGLVVLMLMLFLLNRKKFEKLLNPKNEGYLEQINELTKSINGQKEKLKNLKITKESMNQELLKNEELLKSSQKELNNKNQEILSLVDISKLVISNNNIGETLEYIYDILHQFVGSQRCIFALYDNGKITEKYGYGELGDITNEDIYENIAISYALKQKNPILNNNITIIGSDGVGDCMAIPMIVDEKVIGVIYTEVISPNKYDFEDLNFLMILSNHAVASIRNYELFVSITSQKEEIEALYEETTAINNELNSYVEKLDESQKELEKKNKELQELYTAAEKNYFETVKALANSIEAKDPYTRGHCQRVMRMCQGLAKELGFSKKDISKLRYAAILHDIGKLGISAAIINKPGRLTDEEYNEIKKHPEIGYNILKDLDFMQDELDIILQHHERIDGKGYPQGISGDEISALSKIVSIADSFDAMISDRPYRNGMSIDEAIDEIEKGRGTQFDQEYAMKFISYIRNNLDTVYEKIY